MSLPVLVCLWLVLAACPSCSQEGQRRYPFGEAAYYALSGTWVPDFGSRMIEERFSWGPGRFAPYVSLLIDLAGDKPYFNDGPGDRRVEAVQQISPGRFRMRVDFGGRLGVLELEVWVDEANSTLTLGSDYFGYQREPFTFYRMSGPLRAGPTGSGK